MLRALSVLVFSCLAGCQVGMAVYVGEDEPEALITATQDAAESFNDEIGAELLDVRVVSQAKVLHADLGSIVVTSVERASGPEDRNAFTRSAGLSARISVERRFIEDSEKSVVWLVMHEMGHALGLGHVATEGNLMFENPDYGRESLVLTSKQLRRVRLLAGLSSAL